MGFAEIFTLPLNLRSGYRKGTTPIRDARTAAERLESRLSELVNGAHGLAPEEIAMLWSTAPPRMPWFRRNLVDRPA